MAKIQHVLKCSIYIAFSTLLLAIFSCTSKETAKIRIKSPRNKNKIAYVEEQNVIGTKILDSLYFSGRGALKYKLKLRQPTFYIVRIPSGNDIFLLMNPGDKVNITVDEKNHSKLFVKGSPESEKLNKLYDSLFATRIILDSIRVKYFAAEIQQEKDSLYKEYTKVLDAYRLFSMDFVLKNMKSLVSIAALYQETGENEYVFGRLRDMQFFKIVTDSLTKYFPKQPHVIALANNYKLMYNTYQIERLKASVNKINVSIPEISLPDTKGDSVILTTLKDRYVFLNFWDDQDQISNQMFPELKPVSEKYRNKGLSIYNVYVGKSLVLWKKILKFEEIGSWINVADTSFPYSQSRLLYNIQSIPANYLIDLKEKNILLKDVNPQQLDQYLNKNMKK